MERVGGEEPSEFLQRGRYEVRGVLGTGSQGETLIAYDTQQESEVALKRFRVHGAARWKDVELAEREAEVLASVQHDALPKYLGHFEEAGCLYLVMEHMPGESLGTWLTAGKTFSEDQAWAFLGDFAGEVLSYLHDRATPLIHRDIKPANILRRQDGSFALVDFGSVQHRLRPEGGSTTTGTFGYMAPEQLHGRATPASDVYAVGATLAALLTGKEPEDLPHRGLRVDVARALGGRVEARLVRALEAMLEPDPDRRPTSIAQALAPSPGAKRRPIFWLLAAVVLSTGLTFAWVNRQRAVSEVASVEDAVRHWQKADFAATSRALVGADARVTPTVIAAHLLASQPALAAVASRRLAAEQRADRSALLLCIADALEARHGDGAARERLATAAGAATSPGGCALLSADLSSGKQRLRQLERFSQEEVWSLDSWQDADRWAAALLAFEADEGREPKLPHHFAMNQLFDSSAYLVRRPLGLELSLRWKKPHGQLVQASFESYLGNHAAAARALRQALQAAGIRAHGGGSQPGNYFEYRLAGSDAQRRPHRAAFFLGAVLAARAGEVDNARRYLELAETETHGRRALTPFLDAMEGGSAPNSGIVQYDPGPTDLSLWNLIAKDQPAALVAELRAQGSLGLRVLPFAKPQRVQRPELVRWAETALQPICWDCAPQTAFGQLARGRRLAQTVGAKALDEDYQERLERVRAGLLRRDTAIPLYLLARWGS